MNLTMMGLNFTVVFALLQLIIEFFSTFSICIMNETKSDLNHNNTLGLLLNGPQPKFKT